MHWFPPRDEPRARKAVNLRIHNLLPHQPKQGMHLRRRPPRPREQGQTVILHPPLEHLTQKVPSNLLQLWILRPRPHGHNHRRDFHILEPRPHHPVPHLRARPKVHLERLRGQLVELLRPLHRRAVGRHRPVLALKVPHEVGDLDEAAGFERVEGGGEECWPGRDAAGHGADVDEVDAGLFHEPGLRDVVDFELDVRGDPAGLDWGFAGTIVSGICQVQYSTAQHNIGNSLDPDDVCLLEHVTHLNRPDPCPAADVDDLECLVGGQAGVGQAAVKQHPEDVVLEIESILFRLVVWEQRFAFAVVAVAMLVDELENGGACRDDADGEVLQELVGFDGCVFRTRIRTSVS